MAIQDVLAIASGAASQFLELHGAINGLLTDRKIRQMAVTLDEVGERVADLEAKVASDPAFLGLLQRALHAAAAAESEVKRRIIANVLVRADSDTAVPISVKHKMLSILEEIGDLEIELLGVLKRSIRPHLSRRQVLVTPFSEIVQSTNLGTSDQAVKQQVVIAGLNTLMGHLLVDRLTPGEKMGRLAKVNSASHQDQARRVEYFLTEFGGMFVAFASDPDTDPVAG